MAGNTAPRAGVPDEDDVRSLLDGVDRPIDKTSPLRRRGIGNCGEIGAHDAEPPGPGDLIKRSPRRRTGQRTVYEE